MTDPAAPVRILLVDDDLETAELFRMLMEFSGYEAFCAGSGEEALRVVEAVNPDVICSDIHMPGMSGLMLARTLRASPGRKPLLLIAITGTDGIGLDAKEAGFDLHLTKPVAFQEIVRHIRAFFAKHIGS